MTVKDIYVIEPERYAIYQKIRRQKDKSQMLSAIIKMLLIILLCVILFFSYKIVKQNGYFSGVVHNTTDKKVLAGNYLEVPAREMLISKSFFASPQESEKMIESNKNQKREVKLSHLSSLSSEYVETIQKELNHGL